MQPPQMLKTEKSQPINQVIYLSDPEKFKKQEQLYLDVRKREGRLYSDEIIKALPELDSVHPLYDEWLIRKKSMQRFLSFLKKNKSPLEILDLGCGNGWIANRLAQMHNCSVYAVDLNRLELEQGARVFPETTSLHFVYGNIFDKIFPEDSFDIILMASSVQYFSDIHKLIRRALGLLKENGKIHIIDSPFYTEKSVIAARQRTIDYYQELGYPEMANHYYHHKWTDIGRVDYKINYDPESNFHRFQRGVLKRTISPFPWIIIQK
jgi:ubiquinone/menaquinone biosynthesis C-methylase UbiE